MRCFLLMIMSVALVGCGGDPNKKANELFVEAVQLISSAEEQTGEAAIKDYEQALAHLQNIISDYSESDLAVKLISGETLFTGKSLKEIKERVKELKREAEPAVVTTAPPPEKSRGQRFLDGELTKENLTKLTFLDLQNNQLTDVPKGLEKCTQLTSLGLSVNQLTDVKGLEKLTQLEQLHAYNNKLTDVSPLAELKQLKILNLSQNQIADVSALAGLTLLTQLRLDRNQLTEVKGLEKLTQLTHLDLEGNKLTDVTGLEKLTQLRYLYLHRNELTDVKGLEKLVKLTVLNLENNPDLTKAQIDQLQKALPKCKIYSNPTK